MLSSVNCFQPGFMITHTKNGLKIQNGYENIISNGGVSYKTLHTRLFNVQWHTKLIALQADRLDPILAATNLRNPLAQASDANFQI